MSKKESEFDRIERMQKLEKEAEAQRRKNNELIRAKKKGGRKKIEEPFNKQSWSNNYEFIGEDDI